VFGVGGSTRRAQSIGSAASREPPSNTVENEKSDEEFAGQGCLRNAVPRMKSMRRHVGMQAMILSKIVLEL
jgi:hypothetical protein